MMNPTTNAYIDPNINPLFSLNINSIINPTTNDYMNPVINNNPQQNQATAAAHVVLDMSPSKIYVIDGLK